MSWTSKFWEAMFTLLPALLVQSASAPQFRAFTPVTAVVAEE
jgi:hypothetical protein